MESLVALGQEAAELGVGQGAAVGEDLVALFQHIERNQRSEDVDHLDLIRTTLAEEVWLKLNKIGVWWCDWEVLEVVVEGAVGNVGGEGSEGVLWGVALEVGDIVLGGVPDVFCETQGRGRTGACRWV